MKKRLDRPLIATLITHIGLTSALFMTTMLVAVAPAFAQTEANTLKIGVIGLFSGASADFGVPMLNGIQMAVDEINAVGRWLFWAQIGNR